MSKVQSSTSIHYCGVEVTESSTNKQHTLSPLNATQSITPKDYAHAIDPEGTPDFRLWLEATREEYDLLDKTMGCWEVVDIDTLP